MIITDTYKMTLAKARNFVKALPKDEIYPELKTDLCRGFVYPWSHTKAAQEELQKQWLNADGIYPGFERLSHGIALPDEYEVWYKRMNEGKLIQYHGPTGGQERFLLSTGEDILYFGILADADFALQNTNELLFWDKELGLTVWACTHSGEPRLVEGAYRDLGTAIRLAEQIVG